MKKLLALLLALVMVLSVAACSTEEPVDENPSESEEQNESQPEEEEPVEEETYKVLLLVPAVGDKSYFDGAAAGMTLIEETYDNVETEVIAMGRDDVSVYDQFFTDACESGEYDLIVTGAAECTDALVKAAEAYPDQLFFDFDYQDKYGNECPNIYGVYYKSYDMGYLAGYLASQITVSDMEGANEEKKVGAVLGIDFPDINDFVGSFCQACIDCGVQAQIRYANSFTEPEAGYAVAMELYNDGCDVVWGVAGVAGTGVFTAAAETGHYAFGVDVDQTLTTEDDAERATIVTSFYKDYANIILNAFTMYLEGNYPGGVTLEVGLKEGGVGLVNNEQYQAMVSEEIRASLDVMYEKVNSGEIVPYSVLKNPDEWAVIKAQAEAIEP